MTSENNFPQDATLILEEHMQFTLDDLSCACAVRIEQIIELVDVGVLEPSGNEPAHWQFGGASLHRVYTALRLQRDLEINPAGIALVLELLDEIDSLRARLRSMGDG